MEKTYVIYERKEYILIHQYDSGYCEIKEEGKLNEEIKLVHYSELTMKVTSK
ncbi:hypothetical protein QFZ31_005771 [Neobacillus niacini]|uniref:hypothetical protein n=1 Tax=Neobacillus driksii TaxID=3035913 RepID=UPI00277FB3A9|nr:hypothetical protein [Neobacillus niacini]MDQ0975893.1 hypothetical protein [Neobacillus niacini]